MAQGHGFMVNLSTGLPLYFQYNPTETEKKKSINYFEMPNIGGSYHEKYFTGFSNKELEFSITVIDMDSEMGVVDKIAYFESLAEPSPGWADMVSLFQGNANYPPPKVLLSIGSNTMLPQVYDVMSVGAIKEDLFYDDRIRGVFSIPRRAVIPLAFSLDEDHPMNKAAMIAKKVMVIKASTASIIEDVSSKIRWAGGR